MTKVLISIRLDQEILEWFRSQTPSGYQTKINEVLRDFRTTCEKKALVRLGRAQQIFSQYHARCFWHLRKDLEITPELVPIIQQGLRKFGGREGMLLAEEIEISET